MKTAAAAALLGLLALAACSSSEPRPGRWNPNGAPRDENWHSASAGLLRFDANRDGTLTREELVAGLRADFTATDTNHKNCLDPDQARAINERRVQQDASQATPLVDWNQDGCIDFAEFSGTALSLFATLDADSDGRLTPDELKTRRGPAGTPSGGQGGGRHGRPHGGGQRP